MELRLVDLQAGDLEAIGYVRQSKFHTLFAYHWHTNLGSMDCAAKLGEADYKAKAGYDHGSIQDLLFHLLSTGHGWRLALETGRQPFPFRHPTSSHCKSATVSVGQGKTW